MASAQADVTGKPISTVNVDETGCFAAACLAGVGAGLFASADEPVRAWVRPVRTFEPDPGRKQAYDAIFADYLGLVRAVGAVSHAITARRSGNDVSPSRMPNMARNILVTADFSRKPAWTQLRELGEVTVDGWGVTGLIASEADTARMFAGADIVAIGYEPVTEAVFAATDLKYLASIRGGPGANIDLRRQRNAGSPSPARWAARPNRLPITPLA